MARDKTSKIHKQMRKQEDNQANMQERKQKVVSARDKCKFGLDVHSFVVLKHRQHTSKKDLCMDM